MNLEPGMIFLRACSICASGPDRFKEGNWVWDPGIKKDEEVVCLDCIEKLKFKDQLGVIINE